MGSIRAVGNIELKGCSALLFEEVLYDDSVGVPIMKVSHYTEIWCDERYIVSVATHDKSILEQCVDAYFVGRTHGSEFGRRMQKADNSGRHRRQ